MNREIQKIEKNENVLLQKPAFNDEEKTVFNAVLSAVARSYADLNFKIPEESEITFLVESLTKNIRENYKSIRTAEINQAFANGIRGEYGDFMGLSVISFEKFINGYINSQKRAEMMKLMSKIENKTEPTIEDKFYCAKFNALEALQSIKDGKDVYLYGWVVYDFLDGLKLILLSSEEKNELLKEAEQSIKHDMSLKKSLSLDRFYRLELERKLSELKSNSQSVINRAKALALTGFLQGIIIEEKNLSWLIDEKKEEFLSKKK